MKLKKLLKNTPDLIVRGSKEIGITGLTANSKAVAPGYLFIAKKGLTHNGSRFIPDAVAAGAIAILTDIYDPFFPQVVQLIHPDVPSMEARLARQFYDSPDQKLFLVGITGTNGKTTTAYLVKYLLDQLKMPCGLIGTIEWIVGQHIFPSNQTTPDLITNYKLLSEMTDACVMEVSSHALNQNRVKSIEFDVAIFTNLTQDHLDYHHTMDAYAKAKAVLFSSLSTHKSTQPKCAIINKDSLWHERIVAECQVPILTYGIDLPCDLRAEEIVLSASGTRFVVCYGSKRHLFHSPLMGRFNIYNCLSAVAVGIVRGIPLERILEVLTHFPKVSGRLERVAGVGGLSVFVDYAHTDDALKNVLQTLRELNPSRLITVFGCGGNRDASKRHKMGAIVEQCSDRAIVTNDNPRNEEPQNIINEILSGFREPQKAIVILDREEAISQAITMATPEDIVLIAGKGHETYQIFPHQTINFDDRLVAVKAYNKLP